MHVMARLHVSIKSNTHISETAGILLDGENRKVLNP